MTRVKTTSLRARKWKYVQPIIFFHSVLLKTLRRERARRMYKRLVQRQNARRGHYVRPERVEFTYDDSPNYKGPVVEGWPPTQNRNVTSYINPQNISDFLIRPKGTGNNY